jgi:hypothetical protein
MRQKQRLALKTAVEHWDCYKTRLIDNELQKNGFRLINMNWSAYQLLKYDRNHFTFFGFEIFCRDLSTILSIMGLTSISIVSDSTIGWFNYDDDYNFTNNGTKYLSKQLEKKGITNQIIAINGAGFKARHDEHLDFNNLVNKISNADDPILIIGGWNDLQYDNHDISESIRGILK